MIRLILVLFCLISASGCRFTVDDFETSVGSLSVDVSRGEKK